MGKQVPIQLVRVDVIDQNTMEFGKLYYSEKYRVMNHLCLCGCGHPAPIPIEPGEWSITENNGLVTVRPSLKQRFACKSHYLITDSIATLD